MQKVHFVERLENVHPADDKRIEWESGFWALSEETAARLVGGEIYLHRARNQASHFGGEIMSFRVATKGPHIGRVVFRLRPALRFKGVRTDASGWSQEKKIVW